MAFIYCTVKYDTSIRLLLIQVWGATGFVHVKLYYSFEFIPLLSVTEYNALKIKHSPIDAVHSKKNILSTTVESI